MLNTYKCNNCGADFGFETEGVTKWHVNEEIEPEKVCFHLETNQRYMGFMIKDGEDIGWTDSCVLYDTRKEADIESSLQLVEEIENLQAKLYLVYKRINSG